MLFSENGIITKAREAAEKTEKAERDEAAGMQNILDQMNEILNGETSSGGTEGDTGEEPGDGTEDDPGDEIPIVTLQSL